MFGPGIFVLSGSEIYKILVNTFINTKKTRVSKYVELEKNLEPQAEVGEGPCLASPNSSRCLFSPLSGTALHCWVGVNSCFPLTWHWVHHLYLTSQGSGGRVCSFVTSCTVQQCTFIPFHCYPQPKANCPWETACAGEEPQILGSVAPRV